MAGRRVRRRAGQSAQAVLETALVIPILLFLACGFVGLMLQVQAEQQLESATKLAAESAFQAPLLQIDPASDNCCYLPGAPPLATGPINTSCRYAAETFYGTVVLRSTLLKFNSGKGLCGPGTVPAAVQCNLNDTEPGIAGPVVRCTTQATLQLSKSPIGWAILWDPTISSSAVAVPPPFRERRLP